MQVALISGPDLADAYLMSMLIPARPKRSYANAKETTTWKYKVPNIFEDYISSPPGCGIYYPCRGQFKNLFGLSEKRLCNLQKKVKKSERTNYYSWKGDEYVVHYQHYKGVHIRLQCR